MNRLSSMSFVAALAATLAGCTQFPELDAARRTVADDAPWPRLLPLDPLLATADEATVAAATTDQIAGRGEALRQRAAALRTRIPE